MSSQIYSHQLFLSVPMILSLCRFSQSTYCFGIDSRFLSNITNITLNIENRPAIDSITTTFKVTTTGLRNGTNITCKTFSLSEEFLFTSFLYLTGRSNEMYLVTNVIDKPHWRAPSIIIPREGDIFHSCITRARRYV